MGNGEKLESLKVTCYEDSTDLRELENRYDAKNYRNSRYLEIKISVLIVFDMYMYIYL